MSFATTFIYTMMNNENVNSVARNFNIGVEEILNSNAITDNYSPVRKAILTIPNINSYSSNVYYNVSSGDHLYGISYRFLSSPELIAGINPTITNANLIYVNQKITVPAFIHTIQNNESLLEISNLSGISMTGLARANADRPSFSYNSLPNGFDLVIPFHSSTRTVITNPVPGSKIDNNSLLQGYASEFEGSFLYRVIDDNNQVLLEGSGAAPWDAGTYYGSFSVPLQLSRKPSAPKGRILILAYDEESGHLIDLVDTQIFF